MYEGFVVAIKTDAAAKDLLTSLFKGMGLEPEFGELQKVDQRTLYAAWNEIVAEIFTVKPSRKYGEMEHHFGFQPTYEILIDCVGCEYGDDNRDLFFKGVIELLKTYPGELGFWHMSAMILLRQSNEIRTFA